MMDGLRQSMETRGDDLAVWIEELSLTYRSLWKVCQDLKKALGEVATGIIGVLMQERAEVVVGMIGVLMAWGEVMSHWIPRTNLIN